MHNHQNHTADEKTDCTIEIRTKSSIKIENKKFRFICTLSSFNFSFDCICLTEVHNTNLEHFSSLLNGYKFHPVPSQRGNVGGVCVYVKNDLKFNVLINFTLTCESPCENLWFTLSKNNSETIVSLIYRHPDGNINEFCEKLELSLEKLAQHPFSKAILIGDLNIDLLKYDDSKHKNVKTYLELLVSHGFLPQTVLPSRVTSHSATLIDHVFMYEKRPSDQIIAGNLVTDISDHFASVLMLSKITAGKQTLPKIRFFSERNRAKFKESLQRIDWNDFQQCQDSKTCAEIFSEKISRCFNDCFPLKTIPKKRIKDKPWVSKGLRKCIRKKNKLYKLSLLRKDQSSTEKYKTYKNILTNCLRQAEANYFDNILKDKANAVFRMWALLGPMLNPKKNKTSCNISKIVDKSKRTFTSDADIANSLNNFFCNVGSTISSKVSTTDTHFSKFLVNQNECSFFLTKVTRQEVLNEISRLKSGKAAGHDGIKPDIIKECFESLVDPLTHLYNTSFETGVFPDIWKIAKVIPVFKKGDRSDEDDYRPISLLSCFEKVLERLMCKRMLDFLKKHNILYKLQFGFRENHSTSLALIEALNEIYSKLDEGKFVLGVFLDLKKAFDTIDHKILLSKLEHYGFRGVASNWFCSYLSNRKQFTYVNGCNSHLGTINTGVPQGSVLGPILFTLYVNDMANASQLQPRLFADDTNIFASGRDIDALVQDTNIKLQKLHNWFKANRLKLSIKKTSHCIYSPKRNPPPYRVNVKIGEDIKHSSFVKYLGLTIDEKLTWEKHIEELGNKIVRYASIFRKVRHLLPKKCLQSLYNAFIQCKIDYGIKIYGDASKKFMKRMQTHQNRILEILQHKNHLASTNTIHREYSALKVSDQYELKILKLMHLHAHNKAKLPEIFHNLFRTRSSVHQYSTRYSNNFVIPKTINRFGNQAITVKGPRLWNSQPPELNKIATLKGYLKALKEYKLGSYL